MIEFTIRGRTFQTQHHNEWFDSPIDASRINKMLDKKLKDIDQHLQLIHHAESQEIATASRSIYEMELVQAAIYSMALKSLAYEEALDPNATKADYIGEVKDKFQLTLDGEDGEPEENSFDHTISWTATKEIMKMIKDRAGRVFADLEKRD